MHELHFVRLRVPWIAALEEADRHTHDHRRGEAVGCAPAHRAAIVDLFAGGIGILAELNLRHRHQAGDRHADGATDNAFFGERGVEHALFAIFILQTERHTVHAALGADVFAEHEHARVHRKLVIEGAADRGDHVDTRAFWLGFIAHARRGVAGVEHAAFVLHCAVFTEHETRHL